MHHVTCTFRISSLYLLTVPQSIWTKKYIFILFIFLDYARASSADIICQICLQSKHAKKYKRHLYYHLRKGEVSLDDISEILFQSRYSRSDSRDTISSLKTGI